MHCMCVQKNTGCISTHTLTCMYFQEKYGEPYHSSHSFTCKAQADGFEGLLKTMANKPQDYITPSGCMTTNTVKGFHGLALMYIQGENDRL